MSQQRIQEFRRQADDVAKAHVSEIAPRVTAALENEQLTRRRVERLEGRVTILQAAHHALGARVEKFIRMGFWARVRWLFKGSK